MGGRRSDRKALSGTTAMAVWTAAGTAIAVAAITPILAHWLTNPPDQRLVDLDVYRSGGQALLRGAPLYDFLTQPPQLLPFTYPPFAALLAVPLAFMSWPVAQWVWVALICLALTVTVCYAFRDLLARAGRWAPVAVGALAGATAYLMPVSDQFRFGQVDLFLVALCLADCAARSPRWPRGLLVGLAVAIKLVPGVFLIYLWITGRRQAAMTAVVAAASATLAAFAVLPGDSAGFWFGALLDSDRVGANNGTTNQSIRAVLLRLYLPDSITTVLWLVCVAAVAYFGFRWARRAGSLGTSQGELIGVAITGLLAVALSPVSWIHHLAWIVVVLGALAGDGRDLRRRVLACGVWLAYVLPLPWWGTRLIGPDHAMVSRFFGRIVQSSYGLGAVVLIVVLGAWLTARPRVGSARRHPDDQHRRPRIGTLDP
jgi:alpha-1,2-mannosyltransferase